MSKIKFSNLFLIAAFLPLSSFTILLLKDKPTLYIIGDSTVRNTNKEQWGWGTLIADYFDTTKISISNQAMAGRSTRTFIKEGRWEKVMSTIKKGDFLFIHVGFKPCRQGLGIDYGDLICELGVDSVVISSEFESSEFESWHTWI